MPTLQQLTSSQTSPEVPLNENFETLEHQAVYGKRHPVTTGLVWGYYGGRWAGFLVAAGSLTLAASNTTYIVVALATGVISQATTTTNWLDTVGYARVYKLTTSASAVTAVEDHRAGVGGVHGTRTGLGRQSIAVVSATIRPSVAGGCAVLAGIASAANQPDIVTLDFDSLTEEYAQFSLPMPRRWNRGTITFKALWSHAATTVNFGAVWGLQAVAVGDLEPIAVAYGTEVLSTDTGGTTNTLYSSPESTAITVAGTLTAEDVVMFRVARKPTDAADTLAVDARLHGVVIYITTAAENDA